MFFVPVTDTCYNLSSTYVPVYSTSTNRISTYVPVYSTSTNTILTDDSNYRLNNDLYKVKKELSEVREELNDLRFEKETCLLCSPRRRSIQCDATCLICYPRILIREREENYSRPPSPVHYCSICDDYVIDETEPPRSPRLYKRITKQKNEIEEDKLSEYLSRQLDLQRLRYRYIPQERPVWIPTAYKHDYPHRRWTTRQCNFSEP